VSTLQCLNAPDHRINEYITTCANIYKRPASGGCQEDTMMKQMTAVAALNVTAALAAAIRELGQVPSGSLYAHVMGRIDLETYERMISMLVGAGLIRKRGDLLVWVR
jgi:hypothetical protein